MNKKIISIAIAGVFLAGIGSLAATRAYAFGPRGDDTSMIQRVAERFNLDENEVTEFIQEMHEERQAERKAELENKLNTAVSEGKITEDQKNAILAKIQENMEIKENWQNLSWEERRQQMETHREEMQNWAQENGINLGELSLGREGFGKMESMHHGECLFDDAK